MKTRNFIRIEFLLKRSRFLIAPLAKHARPLQLAEGIKSRNDVE